MGRACHPEEASEKRILRRLRMTFTREQQFRRVRRRRSWRGQARGARRDGARLGAGGEARAGADLGVEGVQGGLLGLVGGGLPLLDQRALGGGGGLEQAQAGGEGGVLQLEAGLQAGLTGLGPDVEELAADLGRVVKQAAHDLDRGAGAFGGAAGSLDGEATGLGDGGLSIASFGGRGRHNKPPSSRISYLVQQAANCRVHLALLRAQVNARRARRGYVSDWSGRAPPYRPKKRSIMPR